jgi:hypothetical protein
VAFKERNDEFYEHYKAGTLGRSTITCAFATDGRPVARPGGGGGCSRRFMDTVIRPAIRAEALELLRRHEAAGEQVILVTATNEFVTAPIAGALGVKELIAVQLERGADGWITGEIAGVPSFREGKVERDGAMAGRARAGVERGGGYLLFGLHQRPGAAGRRSTTRWQPTRTSACAPSPMSAAGAYLICSRKNDQKIHRQAARKSPGRKGGKPSFGKRQEVGPNEHGIDPSLVDDRALNVVHTLKEAGFEAYIVGGAVRDLLVGLRPKDFDVATSATPEQVRGLFRRAFIIGRRFRIVHVVYGRGREHEVIEVSTFRAYMDNAAAEQVAGNEKTSRSELAGMKHAVDSTGRVLRDNVWGPQEEDATRRDFTINAMYYDPETQTVVDYHGGIKDAKKLTIRMIGDPLTRTARIRCASSARCAFAPSSIRWASSSTEDGRAAVECQAAAGRRAAKPLFDEMLKLLQTGHSLATIAQLKRSAWRGASIRCSTWWWSAPTSRSSRPPCRTPTAAWTKASRSRRASCWPACSGPTCATAGRSAWRTSSIRSPPCRTRSTTCSTPVSAMSPGAASWPPTCARSG